MKQNQLGRTGIQVSELCYGSLPIGPLQADYPIEKGADIIRYSLAQGVTFIDTAQRYVTYPHIRKALTGWSGNVVIASKSWAVSYQEMDQAVEDARTSLNRDVIDIFHLHAAKAGSNVFIERRGALDCLCDAKAKGKIRAVGVSTHSILVVNAAAATAEIDVIHPLVNLAGLGTLDGTRDEMVAAIEAAAAVGKGIYLMKALAGGHLGDRFREALSFSKEIRGVAALAVGMMNRAEVDANVAHFEGRDPALETLAAIGTRNKRLWVLDQCKACGSCVRHCPNGAIKVVHGRAVADPEKCLLCGYCVPHCPQFSLRLIDR